MGQGGTITLVNGTPYTWENTGQHSQQMNAWSFPSSIAPGTAVGVYVEWGEGPLGTATDTGDVTYSLGGTGAAFQIQARAGSGFNLGVALTSLSTLGNPQGSTLSLGWAHDGTVNFILAGKTGSFVSSNPPGDWMQASLGTLGARSLRNLCIPGAHDAGMSTYSSGTAFAHVCNTITQTSSILGQLQSGVRYFDIRPVISGGQYYTGHYSHIGQIDSWQGANGQSIASVIDDVNAYTAQNRELVILYLSHDLNTDLGNASYAPFTQDEWNGLLTQLTGLNHLYVAGDPASADLTAFTLADFISGGPAVVVVVDPSAPGISLGGFALQGFYPPASYTVYNQYSDTNDVSRMADDQLGKLTAQRPDPDAGYFLLSWTLTQNDFQSVACALGAESILKLAATANPQLYSRVLPACTAQRYPNILYIDSVQGSDVAALSLAIVASAMAA
jgi:hypothetical protein